MPRAYVRLALVLLIAVVALSWLARRPHAPAPAEAPAPPAPIDTLTVAVGDTSLLTPEAEVTLHHRLALTLVQRGTHAVTVSLSGYEHALAPVRLTPGAVVRDTFELSFPGEDFAWMLDGRPAGRLRVKGSHLVEGHR